MVRFNYLDILTVFVFFQFFAGSCCLNSSSSSIILCNFLGKKVQKPLSISVWVFSSLTSGYKTWWECDTSLCVFKIMKPILLFSRSSSLHFSSTVTHSSSNSLRFHCREHRQRSPHDKHTGTHNPTTEQKDSHQGRCNISDELVIQKQGHVMQI